MFTRSVTIGALAVALGLAFCSSAAAAPNPVLTDKKVRIHAGTDFFGFSHFNPDGDGSNTNVLGFGIGRPTGLDRGTGFAGVGLGLISFGAGAILVDGHLAVGGELGFTVDGLDVGDDDNNTTLVLGRFTPYVNYMFGPFGRFRPWIGLRVGLGGSALHGAEDPMSGDDVVFRTIYPIVGLTGGAHIFLADAVSLDLGITFDYAAPHTKVDCDGCDDDFDKAGDYINLSMPYLGLSAWF